MGFSIIKAETRLASMALWFAGIQNKITDLFVGGVTRTKLECIAVEMEAQDYQYYIATKKAIPTSIYSTFGFNLLPAMTASGSVTFSSGTPSLTNIVIPAGTRVATVANGTITENIYATREAVTLLAGQTTVVAPIIFTRAGSAGNTAANTIVAIKDQVTGIATVYNLTNVSNGTDTETEESRRGRFNAFIGAISRGTNAAVAYGATTAQVLNASGVVTERVVDAKVIGPPVTADSHLIVYIYNGTGVASALLVEQAQKIIDGYIDSSGSPVPGYKAAGDIATVMSVATVIGNVTMAVASLPGADRQSLSDDVESVTTYYIQSLKVGESFVLNELIRRIKSLPGVDNLAITDYPDTVIAVGQVLIPGAITVEVS